MKMEVKHIRHLSKSQQEVWEYLTRPELLKKWLGKTDFQPVVGHKFRFISPYGNDSLCEVLEVIPYARLSYTWGKISTIDNKPFQSTVVWSLYPSPGGGSELHVVHSGFTSMEDSVAHDNGWFDCLNLFEGLLKTGG